MPHDGSPYRSAHDEACKRTGLPTAEVHVHSEKSSPGRLPAPDDLMEVRSSAKPIT